MTEIEKYLMELQELTRTIFEIESIENPKEIQRFNKYRCIDDLKWITN